MKKPKNPRSEAAIRYVLKRGWYSFNVFFCPGEEIIIEEIGVDWRCIINLRNIIRKRQPLTGIKKELAGIVRGQKKPAKKSRKK